MGAQDESDLLRVGGATHVPQLAGAISAAIAEGKDVVLRAIGAGAIAQAVKAAAVARGHVAPHGQNLALIPGFQEVQLPDKTSTAITLRVMLY